MVRGVFRVSDILVRVHRNPTQTVRTASVAVLRMKHRQDARHKGTASPSNPIEVPQGMAHTEALVRSS